MKPRLIILSDIDGLSDAQWLHYYSNALESTFEIQRYDSQALADIPSDLKKKEQVHHRFVHGGIETAVESLCALEPSSIRILAFSIGGTIAWKSALAGLKLTSLYALSATRLRKETTAPHCDLTLWYGSQDQYRPDELWMANNRLEMTIIPNVNHAFYREEKWAKHICDLILTKAI